jgi:hypothetical protein
VYRCYHAVRMRVCLIVGTLAVMSCGGGDDAPSRTYVMGFSPIPARFDPSLVGRTLDMWALRADAGIVLQEPPWAELLAGQDPEALVRANPLGIAELFRAKGLRIIGSIDPTNGLDRRSESGALVAAGRSLSEPAVRELYRRYVGAFVRLVRPERLTVASETNLVRATAPAAVYAAVVAAANAAAAEARGQDPALQLMITIQVEVANGRLPGGAGAGITRDRTDFPFVQALGLSSFPTLAGFGEPEELPLDYYARLAAEVPLPVLVIEGGWPSVNVGGVQSSPEEQRRYIERHAAILDAAHAEGWFQLTFTDLDPAGFPAGIGPFANLGLVDISLQPKPALASWDAVFHRPLQRR